MRTLVPPRLLVRGPAERFVAQWTLALDGDVEGIHQARVASRRLRERLPALARGRGDRDVRRLRRALRHLTRALGPSRELDVSLMVLDRVGASTPAHADAVRATRLLLVEARASAAAVLHGIGGTVDVEAIADQLRAVAGRLETPEAIRRSADLVTERLGRRALVLEHAVLKAGLVYASGPLHGVRIALKKFRYAFEVAECMGRFRLPGSVRRLKDLQDVLGDMHDLQVLAAHVRDAGPVVAVRRRPGVARLADCLDDQVRTLHGRYTIERPILVPILARATRVGQQLGELPPPTERPSLSDSSPRPRPAT